MRTVLRYRWGVALALAVVSALVTASTTFAPLFVRALDRAMLSTTLSSRAPGELALRLTSTSSAGPAGVQSPDQLAALVPDSLTSRLSPAVPGRSVDVRADGATSPNPQARLLWRADACRHVRLTAGRCPARVGEVAVAESTASGDPAWALGREVTVAEATPAVASATDRGPTRALTVVGTWRQDEDPWWLGTTLAGAGGVVGALITTEDTVGGPGTPVTTWRQPTSTLDLAVDPALVGPDDIGGLAAAVTAFDQSPGGASGALVEASSGLPGVAAELARGSDQTRVVVPLLMVQLAVLLGAVLWLLAAAATGQRRAEVAVAKLRGRGVRGARSLLLRETLPAVVAGIPLGLLVAIGAATLTRRLLLPGDAPFELPAGVWTVLAATSLVLVALPVLAVRRVSAEPVATLVRSVAPRAGGLAVGTLEALVVTAAGAAFVGLATRTVSGPVATAAPLLLALAVGLVLARVAALALAGLGRGLLRSRMPSAAAALVAGSRRGTGRWLVPLVTMSVALVVFALNAVGVADRNRTERAEAEVGAPVVLDLGSRDVRRLVTGLRTADPGGRLATPVVELAPTNEDAPAVYAVDPAAFPAVASWPRRDGGPDLGEVRSVLPAVVPLTGRTVVVEGQAGAMTADPSYPDAPGRLLDWGVALRYVRADGNVAEVPIGVLGTDDHPIRAKATIDCESGCELVGFAINAPFEQTLPMISRVTITAVSVDGRPVDIGGPADYRPFVDGFAGIQPAAAPRGVDFQITSGEGGGLVAAHRSIPADLSGLATRALSDGPSVTSADPQDPGSPPQVASSLADGTQLPVTLRGEVPIVPGGRPQAALVDIADLTRLGWQGNDQARLLVYVATDDPARVAALRTALDAAGLPVVRERSTESVANAFAESSAAWSLRLAVVVAVVGLLVAALGLVVLVVSSSRARTRDLAGLRVLGLRARQVRLAAGEDVAPTLVAAAVGAVCGVLGGSVAMPLVPLFLEPSRVLARDDSTAWRITLGAAVLAALALTAFAAVLAVRIARSSVVQRLRESE